MNHVTHPVSSADISICSPTCSLTFIESLRIVLINMVAILMTSVKMTIPGLSRIKIFWKKGYIIFISDVTNKILSRDWNYIVDEVTWPKFGTSSISMREVIINSSL